MLLSISLMYVCFLIRSKKLCFEVLLHHVSKQSQDWVCQQTALIFVLYVQKSNMCRLSLSSIYCSTIENEFKNGNILWSLSLAHTSNYNKFWNETVCSKKFIYYLWQLSDTQTNLKLSKNHISKCWRHVLPIFSCCYKICKLIYPNGLAYSSRKMLKPSA